jgi:hypothetical protein
VTLLLDDLHFLVEGGIAERGLEEEAVELRLRQRERALVLDRVLGSTRVCPSTVTCCSAIASSSADCVFGMARLISSTRMTLAKIGPGRNSKSRSRWLKMESPVTSVGWRSGVHWMREGDAPEIVWAIARASTVLAVPGTSSNRTCPPQIMAAKTSLTSFRLPWTTVSMFSRKRSAVAVARWNRSDPSRRATSVGSMASSIVGGSRRRLDARLAGLVSESLRDGQWGR